MLKIRYVTPFATDMNIGREYNTVISELPDDCYVCLRDADTLFLNSKIGHQIEQIIKDNPEFDVITCMTNRIGIKDHCVPGMFNVDEISMHMGVSLVLWEDYGTECVPTSIAPGMLMIFHKSVWQKHKFEENSIFFDKIFSRKVIQSGGKIGLAKGLYILHLYRWMQENPKQYKEHLKPVPPTPPGLRENHDGLSI